MIIEAQLIEDCKKSNRTAQKKLYDKLLPYLNVVCHRYIQNYSDLNDCLQETFINIFKSIDQYNPDRSKFKTWAVKIAINSTLKVNKRMNKIPTKEFLIDTHTKLTDPSVISKLNTEDLMAFLRTMPSRYLDVFNLHVIDGFSHKEIAKMLQIDESLSRKRLSRARNWLNSVISKDKMSEHDQRKLM